MLEAGDDAVRQVLAGPNTWYRVRAEISWNYKIGSVLQITKGRDMKAKHQRLYFSRTKGGQKE